MSNIWLAFVTGLTTGGISCIAIQGGLLTSAITQQKETKEFEKGNWQYVAMFLIAKLFVYTLVGFLLGAVGSLLVLSLKTQAIMQFAIGLFLIGTAGRLLNLHPIFRYFTITPPKFVYRIARKNSKSSSYIAPAMLGLITVLLPCGVTQAMMMVALGTGDPMFAAATMFAFTLGTSPVFFALGFAALKMLEKKAFSYIASFVVFVFALMSVSGGVGLLGSPHTIQNYWRVITGNYQEGGSGVVAGTSAEGYQEATIYVKDRGYTSDVNTLKVGVPTKLKLVTNNTRGCARAFTLPSFNVSEILPETGTKVIEFTPTKAGRLSYSCSMGMYTGSFTVVN